MHDLVTASGPQITKKKSAGCGRPWGGLWRCRCPETLRTRLCSNIKHWGPSRNVPDVSTATSRHPGDPQRITVRTSFIFHSRIPFPKNPYRKITTRIGNPGVSNRFLECRWVLQVSRDAGGGCRNTVRRPPVFNTVTQTCMKRSRTPTATGARFRAAPE